jgi:hypothetical protein
VPAYHAYWACRVDARAVADVDLRDRVRDAVHAIRAEKCGGDEWLRAALLTIGEVAPQAEVDVLVHVSDYLSWSLWSLRDGAAVERSVQFLADGEPVALDEDWYRPALAIASDDAGTVREALEALALEDAEGQDDGQVVFPYFWPSEDALAEATGAVPAQGDGTVALVRIDAHGEEGQLRLLRWNDGDVDVTRVEPETMDADATRILRALWYDGDIELGMEDVHGLAIPSATHPLTSGHVKARLAAVEELARQRDARHLAALLGALSEPANAGDESAEVRRAIYRAVTWFDMPAVWDAVLTGLAREDARTRETIEYVLWRLEGLTRARPDELAALLGSTS